MLARPTVAKIRPDHLDRRAFVYVRQSTFLQVREHTASTARPYDLVHVDKSAAVQRVGATLRNRWTGKHR